MVDDRADAKFFLITEIMKNPFAPEATSYEEDLEYKMLGDAVFAYMRKEQMYVFDEDEWVDFVGSLFEEECKAAFRRDYLGVEHGLRVMWGKGRYTDPRTQLEYSWQEWSDVMCTYYGMYMMAASEEVDKTLLLREVDKVKNQIEKLEDYIKTKI